jgi:16S rRNA processing protein RimM
VFSYTEPRENVLTYPVWRLEKGTASKDVKVLAGQRQGNNVIATLEGIVDRDQAAALNGWMSLVDRAQLPPVAPGEYYWADLEGLHVVTVQGIDLGKVDYLLETGANDVLVVKGDRERLIPFLRDQTIVSVDLSQGQIVVDWDPDF